MYVACLKLSICLARVQADRAEAHGHWLAAAAVAGPHQATAFAKLGLWYAEVKADGPRARKCFQRSLGLNPLQAEAGVAHALLTCCCLCQQCCEAFGSTTWWHKLGIVWEQSEHRGAEAATLCGL